MDLKINSKNLINSKHNTIKMKSTTEKTSFLQELTNIKKSFEVNKNISPNAYEQLTKIEKLADISILGHESDFFKNNGELDIRKIIGNHGDNIGNNEMNAFEKSVTALWNEGLISNDDYFFTIKWISIRLKADSIGNKLQDSISTMLK